MGILNNVTEAIGNTPIVKINRMDDSMLATVLVKLESFNPASSVKDRIGRSMIEDAEKRGVLNKDTMIIEPTSGNTGVALAYIAAAKGYKLTLTMPDTMSIERRNLLKALGAELILTPGSEGMKGAIYKAEELHQNNKKSIILNQFDNPSNPLAHVNTTAVEIIETTFGKIDVFVAGVGTGGTITGTGTVLKEKIPGIKIVAVEPEASAVLSGGKPGPHKIQGIGAGFVPKVLDMKIVDEVVKVSNEDAAATSRKLSKREGILAGISSGAALYAAIELAKREEYKGKTILAILPDTGERYLSTGLFSD